MAVQETSEALIPCAARCRSCGAGNVLPMLNFGRLGSAAQNLSSENGFQIGWCAECALVQSITSQLSEEDAKSPAFFASLSESLVQQAREMATDLTAALKLGSQHLVIDVSSNDGYLLQWYQRAGIRVLGIERESSIARVAEVQKGIKTVCDPFGPTLAKQLVRERQKADVVHAHRGLDRANNPNEFVASLREILQPDGVIVAEVPYLKGLMDHVQIDSFRPARRCYYSLTALDRLFRRQGLMISEVEQIGAEGNVLRIYARHLSNYRPAMSVVRLLAREDEWVYRESCYREFGHRVEHIKSDVTRLLTRLKAQKKRIALYGSSLGAETLLSYLGLADDLFEYSVSSGPTAIAANGPKLKVFDPGQLQRDQPDYCLVLNWHAAEDILQQHAAYRDRGGKFIIPLPEVRVA